MNFNNKNVYFEIVNENGNASGDKYDTSFVDFSEDDVELESYYYIKNIRMNIIWEDYDEEDCVYVGDKKEIGHISGIYFDIRNAITAGMNLMDTLDEISADTFIIYEALLCGMDEDEIYEEYVMGEQNIFHLTHLSIDEKFRNKGIGSYTVKHLRQIIYYLYSLNIGTILLHASPLTERGEFEENSEKVIEGRKRLRSFYRNLGYNDTDIELYMYQ